MKTHLPTATVRIPVPAVRRHYGDGIELNPGEPLVVVVSDDEQALVERFNGDQTFIESRLLEPLTS